MIKTMKTVLIVSLMLAVCVSVFTACMSQSKGGSYSDGYKHGFSDGYDKAVSEHEGNGYSAGYDAGYADGKSEAEEEFVEKCRVSGEFTACVRDIIPDYILDGETPQVLVLTLFQGEPFLLRVGAESAKQFTVGELYTFTVEEAELTITSAAMLDYMDPAYLAGAGKLEISGVSGATMDEFGMECNRIVVELSE